MNCEQSRPKLFGRVSDCDQTRTAGPCYLFRGEHMEAPGAIFRLLDLALSNEGFRA